MKTPQRSFALPAAAVLLMLLLQLLAPIPVLALRHAAFDQYQRWQPRAYRDTPVRIVDIDEESLARLGQWPWPRTLLAQLVERLASAGATVIAFDVVFAEPDRTAPRALVPQWRLSGSQADQLLALPDPDERFAAAIRAAPVVLGHTVEDRGGPPAGTPPYRLVILGESTLSTLSGYPSAVMPIPVLRDAASGLGAINFRPDPDGIVRRIPMLMQVGDLTVPSLVAETLRVAQATRNHTATGLHGAQGLRSLRTGEISIPTTPEGETWIHYTGPAAQRYLSAWEVLDGSVPAERLRDAVVVVGTSAKGLLDLRFSPMGAAMPGVEAHAQLLEQALTGDFLERPAWTGIVEAIAIAIGGALIAWIALRTGPLLSGAALLAGLALVAGGSWWAYASQRLLVDPTLPAATLLLSFGLGSLIRHLASERRQRWVRSAFSRYVSPNLVTHLIDNPDEMVLGGHRRECSFVFTDLADFTALLERSDPAELVSLLNDYLDGMIRIVFEHEGTLDRIIGDALSVMFSAPVEQADHQRRAYACALDLHRFTQAHRRRLAERAVAFGHTRIGVHSGEVIVGNMGGSTIFDYRALGDPVNISARLETLNKHLGTLICVSDSIRESNPEAWMRPVGRVVLKGRSQALPVFEPLLADDGTPADGPDLDYEHAYALMAANAPEAPAAFKRLAAARPDDPLAAWQSARLRGSWEGDLIVMPDK